MKGISKCRAVAVLSGIVLFSTAVHAMPIPQFDKLTHKQQADYAAFLVTSAADLLKAQGDTAGAEKVLTLFQGKPGEATTPIGNQFIGNINAIRKINHDNAADPTFKPLEVEHALSLALRDNGIFVPPSKLLQVSQNWKPSSK